MLLFPRNCCRECSMGLGGGRGDRGWNSGCRGHPGLEHCSGEQSNNWTSERGPARYGNKSKSVSRFVPPSSSHLLIPRTSIPLSPPLLSVPPSLSPPLFPPLSFTLSRGWTSEDAASAITLSVPNSSSTSWTIPWPTAPNPLSQSTSSWNPCR